MNQNISPTSAIMFLYLKRTSTMGKANANPNGFYIKIILTKGKGRFQTSNFKLQTSKQGQG